MRAASRSREVLLAALSVSVVAGSSSDCVPDPEIQVPDFSVPPAPDLAAPVDMAPLPQTDMAMAAGWQVSAKGATTLRSVWAADAMFSTVYIVGHEGTILRRAGAGDYVAEMSGVNADLHGVVAVSADEAWAVGKGGTILRRSGNKWTREVLVGLIPDLFAVAIGADGAVYAVGDSGTILRHADSMWRTEAVGTMENLRAVLAAGGDMYAAGMKGTVLRRLNDKWSPDLATVAPADQKNLYALAAEGGTIYAAGEMATVLKRDGAMNRWTAEPTVKPMMGQPPHLYGLWAGGGELVAVGQGGAVQRRNVQGVWAAEQSGTAESLWSVTGGGATQSRALLAVGDKGTIARRQ